jgi:hypothetical protein
MIDELIMLLSTDWFLPYWNEIGITIVDEKKIGIQVGCRELVKQILHGADSLFLMDFSEERRQDTDAKFRSLLQTWDAETEVSATWKEWANLSHEELTKAWACSHLNLKLSSGDVSEGTLHLEFAVRTEVVRTWEKFALKPSRFRDISLSSRTEWDVYVGKLFGKPHTLASQLRKVLLDHRLRAFWADISERLTSQQLQELISWYRSMIKSTFQQDRPDLIPSYIS